MTTEENLNLTQKVDTLYKLAKEGKIRKLKIPRKAKVSRSKIKKGWIGILRIDENGNMTGEKQQVIDSTIKLKAGSYHAIEDDERFFFNGKYPIVIQPSWRRTPLRLGEDIPKENNVNEQKYIMARMQSDQVKPKRGFAGWIIGIVVIIAIVIAISYFTKKGGV
jgi:hypothetical protein